MSNSGGAHSTPPDNDDSQSTASDITLTKKLQEVLKTQLALYNRTCKTCADYTRQNRLSQLTGTQQRSATTHLRDTHKMKLRSAKTMQTTAKTTKPEDRLATDSEYESDASNNDAQGDLLKTPTNTTMTFVDFTLPSNPSLKDTVFSLNEQKSLLAAQQEEEKQKAEAEKEAMFKKLKVFC